MPRKPFAEGEVPPFGDAPAVILITGGVEFFVDEAARRAAARLAGEDGEVLRFEEEGTGRGRFRSSDEPIAFFSAASRPVRYLAAARDGDSSGALDQAVEAWEAGTPSARRDAFRRARALISALDLPVGARRKSWPRRPRGKHGESLSRRLYSPSCRSCPKTTGVPRS